MAEVLRRNVSACKDKWERGFRWTVIVMGAVGVCMALAGCAGDTQGPLPTQPECVHLADGGWELPKGWPLYACTGELP